MKIYVGIPTHSETITTLTAMTLLQFNDVARNGGHSVSTFFFSGAMIGELRNVMVSKFLDSDCDLMVMLDSDQGIPPETLKSMILGNRPVVGCFYPKRRLDWSAVKDFRAARSLRDLLYRAQTFVGELAFTPGAQVQFKVENGFAEARYVGTGCIVLQRACLEAMAAHYPELKHRGFNADDYPDASSDWNYGFFNPGWSDKEKRLLAEDYAFCERWRDMGGKIYAQVMTHSTHVGRYTYDGSFIEHLQANHQTDMRVDATRK